MGLASAMNVALSGLAINETQIDVLGNNVANANTVGFKASQVLFATQFSRTLSSGSAPSDTNIGTNPRQIGQGATVAAINPDFAQGAVKTTASTSDLAIQGDGFFVLEGLTGQVYTRNGQFTLNAANEMVNANGLKVLGYGVDDNFNVETTQLEPITIPLGTLQVAQATQNVTIAGALSPSGVVATQGSIVRSQALTDAGAGGAAITGATLLTDVRDGAAAVFTLGETLSFAPSKGGRTLDANTLTVGAATTVNDLLTLMDDTFGIQSGGAIPGTPGARVTAAGEIELEGNRGTANALQIAAGDLASASGPKALNFTTIQAADGESTFTSFVVYDSLGQPITIGLTAVLENSGSTSLRYRFFGESYGDSEQDIALGTGTLEVDGTGRVTQVAGNTFSIDRNSTPALSPLNITLDFSNVSGLSSGGSALSATFQDGFAPGKLTDYSINDGGFVTGLFSNGVTRTLGQLVLARFINPVGLVQEEGNTFREGVNSGLPIIAAPGQQGTGTVLSGALELSNSDIGASLVDLILASTSYRGNTRIIGAVQELIDELLTLRR